MLSPISNRQARVSYGIVVNQRYNPKIHQGLSYSKDSRDGKNWVMDQVEWLIRQVQMQSSMVCVLADLCQGRAYSTEWLRQAYAGKD